MCGVLDGSMVGAPACNAACVLRRACQFCCSVPVVHCRCAVLDGDGGCMRQQHATSASSSCCCCMTDAAACLVWNGKQAAHKACSIASTPYWHCCMVYSTELIGQAAGILYQRSRRLPMSDDRRGGAPVHVPFECGMNSHTPRPHFLDAALHGLAGYSAPAEQQWSSWQDMTLAALRPKLTSRLWLYSCCLLNGWWDWVVRSVGHAPLSRIGLQWLCTRFSCPDWRGWDGMAQDRTQWRALCDSALPAA
eukprot:364536-Chlamydomonas_euryale.AAC.23